MFGCSVVWDNHCTEYLRFHCRHHYGVHVFYSKEEAKQVKGREKKMMQFYGSEDDEDDPEDLVTLLFMCVYI